MTYEPKPGVIGEIPHPKDWVLGSVSACPWEEVNPSGDWRDWKPEPHETQLRDGIDLAMCTNFAATDTVETILCHLYGERENYNERALAVMSGQGINGNHLRNVAEAIRTKGLVPDDLHPWEPDRHGDYSRMMAASPDELNDWETAGKAWLDTYDFRWEWVYDDFGRGMEDALRCSPLFAASLYASEGNRDEDGTYLTDSPNSPKTTHAVVLMRQKDGYKWVDDSYRTQIKRLAPDFRVPLGIRFRVRRKGEQAAMHYPPKNSLVIVPETGERMMYVDGDTIFRDDAGKILLEVTARNSQDGVSMPYPVVHVRAEDVKHLRRINLKGEKI